MKSLPDHHLNSSLSTPPRPNYRPYKDPYIDHQDPTPIYPLPFPMREVDGWFHAARVLSWGLLSSGWVAVALVTVEWVGGGGMGGGWIWGSLRWMGRIYAVAEIISTFYQLYLAKSIQPPSPPSILTPEQCLAILTRILQSGTGVLPIPPRAGEVDIKLTSNVLEDLKQKDKGTTARKRRGRADELRVQEAEEGSDEEGVRRTRSPLIPLERLGVDDPRAIEFRERLRNWFDRKPFEDITDLDARTWLSWSCCGLPYPDVQARPELKGLVDMGVEMLQARTGWTFPQESSNLDGKRKKSGVKLMRLTMDPVRVIPRPLWWYLALWAGQILSLEYIYRGMGLVKHKQGEMEYLVRVPRGWTPDHELAKSDPIVFIHGLGFGLVSVENMLVIRKLCKTLSSHPLLIPMQPHIGQQFFHPRHLRPTSRKAFVEDLVAACKHWKFYDERGLGSDDESDGSDAGPGAGLDHLDGVRRNGGVVLLSHSNGSVGHTWLLKDKPGMTKRNALVDPIVFCSWEGDICYNFCYRKARTGLEYLLKYLISTELGIANSIQRHFDWSANTLFPEEIPDATDPEKTLVVLGGTDIIVDAKRVRTYLKRHGMRRSIQYDPRKGHTDGLRGTSLDRLMIWLATGKSVDIPVVSITVEGNQDANDE